MVTVVDAYNFLKDYGSTVSIQSRGESLGEEDKRSVVDLLIDQIEFCDVLIVNVNPVPYVAIKPVLVT